MNALFIGFAVYVIASIICGIVNKIPRTARKTKTAQKPVVEMYTPATANNPVSANLTILCSLQEQRDIITDLLSDVEFRLDAAPPEKTREKLLKDKARLFGQLATVETKINRLTR